MKNHTGFHISVDGIDGAGKTTMVKAIADALVARGVSRENIITLRDPGSTDFGESIRKVLKQRHEVPIDKVAEFLAFNAARAQLVAQRVVPNVQNGRIVITDRFAHSTYAYQGVMRGLLNQLGEKSFFRVLSVGCREHTPALTLWLDTPPEVARQRSLDDAARSAEIDVFDEMPIETYRQIHEAFRKIEFVESSEHIFGKTARVAGDQEREIVVEEAVGLILLHTKKFF